MTIRGSIVVSISACHAEDPGSIPGRGDLVQHSQATFLLHIHPNVKKIHSKTISPYWLNGVCASVTGTQEHRTTTGNTEL